MIIDVFNHFMPKPYLDRLLELIPGQPATTAFPRLATLVDVEARIRLLEQFGDLRQVLSLANPPLELVGAGGAHARARAHRQRFAREICDKHPDRFPAFIAALPMNDIEASLSELDRAITSLGARGIQLFTNVAGKPLSAPEYRPDFSPHGRARSACLDPPDARPAIFRLCVRADSPKTRSGSPLAGHTRRPPA